MNVNWSSATNRLRHSASVTLPRQLTSEEEAIIHTKVDMNFSTSFPTYSTDTRYLVLIDTERLDICWKQNSGYQYVGSGGTIDGSPAKYRHYVALLPDLAAGSRSITAPRLKVFDKGNPITVQFDDGRHRYAVLRDAGISQMPITVTQNSYDILQKHHLINRVLDKWG